MFDHVAIQVADVPKSLAFYLRLLAPLGIDEVVRFPREGSFVVGLGGSDGRPMFWLGPALRAEDRELHLAFTAPDRDAVDAVYSAAVDSGVEVLNAPREWPEYHPGYYAVFLRDPDGHNIEAVTHH